MARVSPSVWEVYGPLCLGLLTVVVTLLPWAVGGDNRSVKSDGIPSFLKAGTMGGLMEEQGWGSKSLVVGVTLYSGMAILLFGVVGIAFAGVGIGSVNKQLSINGLRASLAMATLTSIIFCVFGDSSFFQLRPYVDTDAEGYISAFGADPKVAWGAYVAVIILAVATLLSLFTFRTPGSDIDKLKN